MRVPCEWRRRLPRGGVSVASGLDQSQRLARVHSCASRGGHTRSEWLRLALRSGPTTVLVLSLLFIAFVVLLHIWGKFRRG